MKDSTSIIPVDTIQPIVQDTSVVSISGTTEVKITELPQETQPNGWVQLLLPIVITLFVVFVEKWVNRWYEQRDKRKARKQYRQTVLDWIAKVKPIEEGFRQSVSDLAKAVGKSDDMQPEAYAMPLTMHDKLGDMSIEKMTDAFLKDFKDDSQKRYANMYNIISNFEYLKKISEKVEKSYEAYNKQAFALCQEWNELYEKFIEEYHTLDDNHPYAHVIAAWMIKLNEKPSSVEVNIQYTEALSAAAFNEKDFDTISLVSKMNRVAKQSQALSFGYRKVFADIADNVDLSLASLTEAEQYFRTIEKH